MIREIVKDFRSSMKARGLQGPRGALELASHYLYRTWLLSNLVPFAPHGMTIPLHRGRGVTIGENCFIDPTAVIETSHADRVFIGDDVRITAHAIVMAHILPGYHLRERTTVPNIVSKTVIEDHAFIGVNAVVMPGVRVGKGAVVASGAVVFTSVAPYTMVMGNPAKKVKDVEMKPVPTSPSPADELEE